MLIKKKKTYKKLISFNFILTFYAKSVLFFDLVLGRANVLPIETLIQATHSQIHLNNGSAIQNPQRNYYSFEEIF